MATQNSNRIPRKPGELEQKFREVVGLLEDFCARYDDGVPRYAQKIAGELYILLCGKGSLLSLLGREGSFLFVDTALHEDRVAESKRKWLESSGQDVDTFIALGMQEAGLAMIARCPDGSLRWTAPLDRKAYPSGHPLAGAYPNPPQEFGGWWRGVVVTASDGEGFSRDRLVRAMRDQDGGGHVDGGLEPGYAALREDGFGNGYALGGDFTMHDPPGGWLTPDGAATHACVRQIAYEVQVTFRRELADLLLVGQ